jgi:pimeloyl-ACP methyl ester carboxylesterase
MTEPVERRVALPALTLAAQVWGVATLPPLLALHGWLDNGGSYARLAPLLAERWLQPYTDATVRRLAADGVRRLDVACPGFAVDCLETLEEIAMQNRDFFTAAGGETLRYIPALNDGAEQVASLAALVRRHLGGWPEGDA